MPCKKVRLVSLWTLSKSESPSVEASDDRREAIDDRRLALKSTAPPT
jgi:hypothetical protein